VKFMKKIVVVAARDDTQVNIVLFIFETLILILNNPKVAQTDGKGPIES
jgi:hypothetical protein